MPARLLRLLIVMLLALTVPVQGLAAASAGVCMALGHHESAAPAEHPHEHDAAGAHGHGHHAPDEGQGSADAHCPPCVSCCAAAAIASFSPLMLHERPAVLAVRSLPPLFSGVTLENLDRPPLAP